MRPHDDDRMSIESLLAAERPEPRPEFAAELDARAAKRFAKPPAPKARAFRLRYAFGAASIVVVTAVAVSASGVLDEYQRPSDDVGAIPSAADQLEDAPQLKQELGDAASERVQSAPVQPTLGGERPRGERQVARTADLALSTAPADVPEVADGVIDVTHRYRGFVLDSTVSSNQGRSSRGDFSLKLPARTLQPALDDLSELAHVSSLTEGTDDITQRFTSGRNRISELTEQRERLRAKLGEADTIDERRSIRFKLRDVRRSLEAVRADLAQATERVRFVPVHVGIKADAEEVATGWSIGDALDDAVRVLEVAVGIALIALAAGVPIALVALLAWLAARAWLRSRREQALDEQPRGAG
jgi:hypothetical protein